MENRLHISTESLNEGFNDAAFQYFVNELIPVFFLFMFNRSSYVIFVMKCFILISWFHTEKRKTCNFCGITLFITNAFSTSHVIKLLVLFIASVKIMRCTFIVQKDGYCLKLKWCLLSEDRKVSWQFFISAFILCLEFLMT